MHSAIARDTGQRRPYHLPQSSQPSTTPVESTVYDLQLKARVNKLGGARVRVEKLVLVAPLGLAVARLATARLHTILVFLVVLVR